MNHTQRRRIGQWTLSLTVLVLAAAPALGGLRDDYQKLLEIRNDLAEKRDSRPGATSVEVRFDNAADRDDMDLTLRRRHDDWTTAFATVPGWEQSTMQEWRGFYHGNRGGDAWRAGMRFDADPHQLRLEDGKLAGTLDVTYRLDQTRDQQYPPGEPLNIWDRFIPAGHSVPRPQQYDVDAKVTDGYLLEMVLGGGVRYESGDDVAVRPALVRLRLPATRFTLAEVTTPTFNGGLHEADATGLTFTDGRLRGELVITYYSDGWFPLRTRDPQKPLVQTYQIDAELDGNALRGTFDSEGWFGRYEGTIRGQGGKMVAGRYHGTGELDEQVGTVRGMLLDAKTPVSERLADRELPADEEELLSHAETHVGELLHEIRALHLALQQDLPLHEALIQTDYAQPVFADGAYHANVGAYVAEARRLLEDLPSPDASLPADNADRSDQPQPNEIQLGTPSPATARPLPDSSELPGDAGPGWYYLPDWRIIGPFTQRPGLENTRAFAPEIVPAAAHRQATDRFGAGTPDADVRHWQQLRATGPRIGAPWDKTGFFVRFKGEMWYAANEIRSDRERPVLLAVETGDGGKLWLNGKLLWADEEKAYRTAERGYEIVRATLQEGRNHLLIRGERDRRPSWVRLAIAEPQTGEGRSVRQRKRTPDDNVFPDAQGPRAWDIEEGINVAWRSPELTGRTRPVPVDGDLLITSGIHTLQLVDGESGEIRWTREANVLELIDPQAMDAWASADADARLDLLKDHADKLGRRIRRRDLTCRAPTTDGRRAYLHTGTGVAACYELSGDRKWMTRTGLQAGVVHRYDDMLVIEGQAADNWPVPEKAAGDEDNKKLIGVIALHAGTGEILKRWTMPGSMHGRLSRILRVDAGPRQVAVLHTSTGQLIDLKAMERVGPFRVEHPGNNAAGGADFAIAGNRDKVYLTSQEQIVAARLWPTENSSLEYDQLWESNYEHSGFDSFVAPSVATDDHLFWWAPVLSRGPHCPDARVELHVQDARTGRPLNRLKPALENAVRSYASPVVAGDCLYSMDLGGGTHGGLQGHGQILVTTADEQLQVIARNLVDVNSTEPVFIGERMYLRSPQALTCIAVTDDKGRAYQARREAETLLAELGSEPVGGDPRTIAPAEQIQLGPHQPRGMLRDGRPTDNWLGFGPVPPSEELPNSPDQQASQWRPLSRDEAFNVPPAYTADTTLQGTGEIVPVLRTLVDPRAVSGPDSTGMLYTVLDNPRERIVLPELQRKGVTQWLAGEQLRPDQPLLLPPGLYPYRVRVSPEYYQWDKPEIVPPVNVSRALQAGAIRQIGWPEQWTVFGPLPADTAPLEDEKLAKIPQKISVGGRDYPGHQVPVDGQMLNLTSLIDLRPGQEPDVESAPVQTRIGTPSQAYAYAEITVPSDGVLYVNMAADWFSRWYLDGERIYDTMDGGNGAPPRNVTAHPLAVKVNKGTHVLAVQVKPGSEGWSLTSAGGFAAGDGAAKGDYSMASKIEVAEPDWRFEPAFKVIPHPPTRRERWQRKREQRRQQIRRLLDVLPADSEPAHALRELRQGLE